MLILHALLADHTLALWAEQAFVRRKGRLPQNPLHPGALPLPDLDNLLKALVLSPSAQAEERLFYCPSSPSIPLPSHPILGEQTCKQVRLSPWRIACRDYSPLALLPWLLALPERELYAPGIMLGPELRFLQGVLRWALKLTAEQQFLPALVADQACWQAQLNSRERMRLHEWASALPPALYALATTGPDPVVLLEKLLSLLLDAVIRSAVSPPLSKPRQDHSAYDAWLQALGMPSGRLIHSAQSLEPLAKSLAQWKRPLQALNEADWRLGLLVHDAEPEEPWLVEGFLQSHADPSLRLPLQAVWQINASKAKTLSTSPEILKEYLLLALGQACAIYPPLQALLQGQRPQALTLSTAEIWSFLAQAAPLLEAAGFALFLPTWWTQPKSRNLSLRVQVRAPKLKGRTGLDLATVMQVNWEVALGEEHLSAQELTALAKFKQPLVMFRGQWRIVDQAEIQKALAFLKRQPSALTLQELVPLALGASEAPLPISAIEAQGRVRELFAQLQGQQSFGLTEIPAGFKGTLRPYQIRGLSWLQFLHQWGLGACLADDMGLGKTPQTLARILKARLENPAAPPVLLICPTTLVGNWKREAAHFTPDLKVFVHHGAERLKLAAFKKAIANQDLVITTYGLLHRDLAFLQPFHWQGIVLDEAQGIKNAETRQSQSARSLKAQWRVALTGTPIENHVGDLWSLMDFLNPGLLGSQSYFRLHFQQPIQAFSDPQTQAKLKARIEPFMLRRLKTDKSIISDLPEKLEMELFCPLTREQASLYQAQLKQMQAQLAKSEGFQRKGLVLSSLMRFKQLCNHPAQFLGEKGPLSGRSGKLMRLEEMLEEILEMDESVLIFSQFAEMGALLQTHLQNRFGEEVLLLTGKTPKTKRDQLVERFQSAGGPRIFVLSLKAGGTGLNLTRANHVFHFDRWWNPAIENQATDRAFRIGQTRQVQVHKLICGGTVEERIAELLLHKQDLANQTVGHGENWLTELSNQQIQDLFQLNLAEAVSE